MCMSFSLRQLFTTLFLAFIGPLADAFPPRHAPRKVALPAGPPPAAACVPAATGQPLPALRAGHISEQLGQEVSL